MSNDIYCNEENEMDEIESRGMGVEATVGTEFPTTGDIAMNFWKIGKNYFIRGITMHYIGCLQAYSDDEILLSDACWVADSGRFNAALTTGHVEEAEPYVDSVLLNRKAFVDATPWQHPLIKNVK